MEHAVIGYEADRMDKGAPSASSHQLRRAPSAPNPSLGCYLVGELGSGMTPKLLIQLAV